MDFSHSKGSIPFTAGELDMTISPYAMGAMSQTSNRWKVCCESVHAGKRFPQDCPRMYRFQDWSAIDLFERFQERRRSPGRRSYVNIEGRICSCVPHSSAVAPIEASVWCIEFARSEAYQSLLIRAVPAQERTALL